MTEPTETERISASELTGAQETLLVPLWARAVESDRENPILIDPRAREIVKSIDYDFTRFGKATTVQVACCLRALIIDRWVQEFLQDYPSGTVVEIGAGLDTRFERLDNGRARWFDLDLPEAMALRGRFFTENDRRTFITQSVFDWDWIETVKQASDQPVLFIGDGVIYYFEETRVKELFAKLAEHFPGCRIAFDSNTRKSLNYSNRYGPLRHLAGSMAWAIEDVQQINSWSPGYDVTESKPAWDLPEFAAHYRRLPTWLRLTQLAYPASRRMYRINLVRLGQRS